MDYQNNYNQATTQNDGSYGWDDVIKEESSFILLPAGDYRFTIKDFSKARYNGGDKVPACNKAVVTFEVYTSDGRSIEVTENFLLHQKMEWKLSEFFASIGLKKKNEPVRMMWSPELIGKTGVCKLNIHNYQKNGENKQINRIEKLYPSYDQPAVSQSVQPLTQPVQGQASGWTQGKF